MTRVSNSQGRHNKVRYLLGLISKGRLLFMVGVVWVSGIDMVVIVDVGWQGKARHEERRWATLYLLHHQVEKPSWGLPCYFLWQLVTK